MKKILAIVTMAAMVAGAAFAAEPEADFNLAEVSGNASVTWGVDLDEGKTGFKNETGAKIKLNLVNSGTKSTSGEGIWAELGIKLDNNMVIQADGDGKTSAVADGKIVVDVAKLHFYNFYVGIKSGDTMVGEFKVPNAVYSSQVGVANVVATDHSQGIVVGYGDNKNFGFDFDFRSNKAPLTPAAGNKVMTIVADSNPLIPVAAIVIGPDNKVTTDTTATLGTHYENNADGTFKGLKTGYSKINEYTVGAAAAGADNYYTNDYGLAAEFKILDSNTFANGLAANLGASVQLGTTGHTALGLAASASYKLSLDDTYYVKPSAGFTMAIADLSASNIQPAMALAGGVLFGWGAEADANAGVPYLSNDNAKKVTPGIGAAAVFSLGNSGLTGIQIIPSFYSGELIPNLTAAVLAEINLTGLNGTATTNFGVAGGLKYAIKATDSVTVTPFAGLRFSKGASLASLKGANEANKDNGGKTDAEAGAAAELLNVKVGFDVAGLINNTTFSVNWTSRDLMSDSANKSMLGTINVTCKIAL